MSRARVRLLVGGMVLLFAAAALAVTLSLPKAEPTTAGPGKKPTLLLLTSLPLIFNEDFSLQGGGSPAFAAIASRYNVAPISTTNAKEVGRHKLLLMAHPLAQTAENLVDLDDWVRRGGRVLLLADPRLDWPSTRPLGDPLRPPPMFTDTGLLAHWGLMLHSPAELGPEPATLGGYDVMTVSPGALSGGCPISDGGLVAHCRIGKGQVTVIADADVLNAGALPGAEHNLDAILSELSALAH